MSQVLPFSADPYVVVEANINANSYSQPLKQAMLIEDFRDLVVTSRLLAISGSPAAPTLTVELWTGMQTSSDDGWVRLYSFAATSTLGSTQKVGLGSWYGLLRFLRYKVTFSAASTRAATFMLEGLGR